MRNHIKALVVFLVMVLFAGIMYLPQAKVEAAAPKEFSDVDLAPSSDGYKAIYWAVEKGVTTGIKNTDKFGPSDACTRSQAVTFIWRLAGKPDPSSSTSSFSDIDAKFKKERSDMYKAILWATDKKIVAGYSDGTFRPNTKCTRAHIVTFLYRYAGKPDQKKYSSKKSPFTDVKTSIGKDMYPAILWAKDKGVTTGISGTKKFDPKGTCTRKQIVTFLWRYDGKNKAAPTATPTATPTAEPTATPTAEPTATPIPNGKDTTPYKKITLDGVKDHRFTATDYCYIESDKFVLLMEKDAEIPGDFCVNIEAIISEIESQLGVRYDPDDYEYSGVIDMSIDYGGFNPWEGWDIGRKIPIFLFVDYNDEGMNPNASDSGACIESYDLMSDKAYNAVPRYRDNPNLRLGWYDYSEVTHELTHVITMRNCTMTGIMTEGIAEYMGSTVIKALAGKYPSIGEVYEKRYLFDYPITEPVNAQNAEKVFIYDYHIVDPQADNAHYAYGRYLFQFLNERSGKDYFRKIYDKIVEKDLYYNGLDYDEKLMAKYAGVLKELFGNDIFTKFGDWCVANDALQHTEGVFPIGEE